MSEYMVNVLHNQIASKSYSEWTSVNMSLLLPEDFLSSEINFKWPKFAVNSY